MDCAGGHHLNINLLVFTRLKLLISCIVFYLSSVFFLTSGNINKSNRSWMFSVLHIFHNHFTNNTIISPWLFAWLYYQKCILYIQKFCFEPKMYIIHPEILFWTKNVYYTSRNFVLHQKCILYIQKFCFAPKMYIIHPEILFYARICLYLNSI